MGEWHTEFAIKRIALEMFSTYFHIGAMNNDGFLLCFILLEGL
jgi:hypothetical protein